MSKKIEHINTSNKIKGAVSSIMKFKYKLSIIESYTENYLLVN